MNVKRSIKKHIISSLSDNRVTIIYGARQVGKTTLCKEIIEEYKGLYLLCDEPDIREAFSGKTSTVMKSFIGDAKLVILDEAQRIFDIGITLKLLHDVYPEIKIIATGSSSFDLSNKINEPLTGRNIPFMMFPLTLAEYRSSLGEIDAKRLLEQRIIYGMYPHVVGSNQPAKDLEILANDYLLKDVFRIGQVRKPIVIEKLVRLLALQSGSEVSYNELAQKLETSRQTVMEYIRLLEQAFVIFRLPPFGKNPRNEVTRFEKVFFYDTGIRNALIGNWAPLEMRLDKGALFENFFISERFKQYSEMDIRPNAYFWRTKDQSEIDLVEEFPDGTIKAYECKWDNAKISTRAWNNAFPEVSVTAVTKDNLFEIQKL